ncbi:MAG: VOC family protein [Chitinophagaceae bacterium]
MIKGLYETHISVASLERSVDFYKNVLGLQLAHLEEGRRIAFFWIGKPKEYMLGVWEKPKDELQARHFAFHCDADFILNDAVAYLKERNLQPYNFLKDGKQQPMVFAWMPAIAIYFNDPDGNILEFIAVLEGDPHPELGVITYEEWIKTKKNIH